VGSVAGPGTSQSWYGSRLFAAHIPKLLHCNLEKTNKTYRALNESQELLRGAKVNDFGPRNHLFHLIKNKKIFFCQSVFVGDHSFKCIKNTAVDRSRMRPESLKASVPHPDNVLLVLCPILKLWRRQTFWWFDPKPRHQEIEQRFHIRERLVSQQERLGKCHI
jgi:hypothetical protein